MCVYSRQECVSMGGMLSEKYCLQQDISVDTRVSFVQNFCEYRAKRVSYFANIKYSMILEICETGFLHAKRNIAKFACWSKNIFLSY